MQDTSVNQVQNQPEVLVPINVGALNGLGQFSEIVWVAGNSVSGTRDLQGGPAVMVGNSGIVANAFGCYHARLNDEVGLFQITVGRFINGADTTLITTGTDVFAANAIVRLVAQPQGGNVLLTLLVNGIQIAQFLDNVAPIITGIPGISRHIWISNATPGTGSQQWKNFLCDRA